MPQEHPCLYSDPFSLLYFMSCLTAFLPGQDVSGAGTSRTRVEYMPHFNSHSVQLQHLGIAELYY